MYINLQLTCDKNVTERVFYFYFDAVSGCEEVVSHRNGPGFFEDKACIFESHLGPWLDCKSSIFRARTILSSDEVGQRLSLGCTKLLVSALGWLKKDGTVSKVVSFVQKSACVFFTCTSVILQGANLYNSAAPFFLCCFYCVLRNHVCKYFFACQIYFLSLKFITF